MKCSFPHMSRISDIARCKLCICIIRLNIRILVNFNMTYKDHPCNRQLGLRSASFHLRHLQTANAVCLACALTCLARVITELEAVHCALRAKSVRLCVCVGVLEMSIQRRDRCKMIRSRGHSYTSGVRAGLWCGRRTDHII